MRSYWKSVLLNFDVQDLVIIVGIGLIFGGLSMVNLAVALVVTGTLIFLLGTWTFIRPSGGQK